MKKSILLFFFFTFLITTFAQDIFSAKQLKATTWQSDDGKTSLKFLNETQVVRIKNNKEITANYFVEKNIVIITNGFVKIPLTFTKGVLKGFLTYGESETTLRKK